jgi:hypothetical protein
MDIPHAINHCRPGSKWTLNGETYAGLIWLDAPETKPTESELAEAWEQISSVKSWPSKAEFWAEFTNDEKAGIITSANIGIRMLDKELTMWTATVRADDQRIIDGLTALASAGIISGARKTAILT